MDLFDWLLDSDPAIRWQVRSDLMDESPSDVMSDRGGIAEDGWGKRLLLAQTPDGQWGGGFYSPKWISTNYTLLDLRHFGIDQASSRVVKAIERITQGGLTWKHGVDGGGGAPFFGYIGEACVTGMNIALASYFGTTSERTADAVEHLLDQQMADGGWNCQSVNGSTRSSFHTTITTLEALLEFEGAAEEKSMIDLCTEARGRGHEYLLERRLMRSLRTGEVVNESWKRFSFPPRWWFDVLRGLDYLRLARVPIDSRWGEALDLVESKRLGDGRWNLQNHHSGREHFRMEEPGKPSRWNTLRSLRVLRYAGRA